MKDASTNPPHDAETHMNATAPIKALSQIESLIRRHPVLAALATVGAGCAIGIVARELLTPPETPRRRALQLLEDIQSRLAEFAEPAYDHANHLADESVGALKRGLHSVSDSKLGSRLSRLFS